MRKRINGKETEKKMNGLRDKINEIVKEFKMIQAHTHTHTCTLMCSDTTKE